MIDLTVKTLDSQNHAFTVEDDMTVAQFKEKIADTVNIPADTQRIIYCGRLLQDNLKLSEYDVNGKVVHLVQRPPPSTTNNGNQQPEPQSPQPQRRIRGLEYLGSMRLPANVFDQNFIPPLPTHSLAASRLNVARRMLRRADVVLTTLENPTTRTSQQQQQDQPQDEPQEEVTPVFEARVIVPNVSTSETLLSVEDAFLHRGNTAPGSESLLEAANLVEQTAIDGENPHSISSTPEVITPLAASTENLAAPDEQPINIAQSEGEASQTATNANDNPSNSASTERISRTSEYATLLNTLNRLHIRLAPFLEQYNDFMRDDPVISPENARSTQAMINRVSEILHFLGHAYHSLSDIIVRVRSAPPRPLLCRPILIQHSAIVQAGIPIQVEAQINFSADRNAATATSQPSSTTTTSTTNQSSTVTTTSSTLPTVTAHMIPLISSPRVQVEAFELSQLPNADRTNTNRMNNNRDWPYVSVRSIAELTGRTARATPTTIPNPTNPSAPSTDSTEGNTTDDWVNADSDNTTNNPQVSMNNPNVEYFMEVTPESITIDSLETSFVAPNQTDIMRTLNQPPPELFHSIMQMAGQLISRGPTPTSTNNTTTANQTPPQEAPQVTSSTTSTNDGAARTIPFQNSQARGNTQTQPTTATQTRSTARAHVHLAQHAMQGFDPFLPCNSHHVTIRRGTPPQPSNTTQPNNNQQNRNSEQPTNEPRTLEQGVPFYNIMRSIINSVRSASGNQQNVQQPSQGVTTTTVAATTTSNTPSTTTTSNSSTTAPPAANNTLTSMLETLDHMNRNLLQSPTIAQLIQQNRFPDETYVEGEHIMVDLMMLFARNLTIGDLLLISSGRNEPLNGIRTQLRNFFLYRVLDGRQETADINRGIERLMTELQPFFDDLFLLDTKDDINIVGSVQFLLRERLPVIISLIISSENNLSSIVDEVRTVIKMICALAIRASQNGRQGVRNLFDLILTRYVEGMPVEFQRWAVLVSRSQIDATLAGINVPESAILPFIVKNGGGDGQTSDNVNNTSEVEPMQVDEEPPTKAGSSNKNEILTTTNEPPSATESSEASITFVVDSDTLPTIVLGSESWHEQVPSEWVPIITRDSQRQRKQHSQPPYSDAYLSGMPSKRRKIVASSKPQGSLPQAITDSVRTSVIAAGLSNVAPLESIAQAAGTDVNIQSAYRDLLRSSIQSDLSNNEDFTPERFPNASNYFNSPE